MKRCVISEDLSCRNEEFYVSLIGSLTTLIDNIIYGYNLPEDTIADELIEIYNDHDVKYEVEEEDI